MSRRNGMSDTLKAPINSYPCKYESFQRDYKIVEIDTMKLNMIYFNYGSQLKTKKRSEKICKVYKLVGFHAGPMGQGQTHFRPRHSLRPRSVALTPNLLSLMPPELPQTLAPVTWVLTLSFGTSLLAHSPPLETEFQLFLPCLLGLKCSLALNHITFCQNLQNFLGSTHCWFTAPLSQLVVGFHPSIALSWELLLLLTLIVYLK